MGVGIQDKVIPLLTFKLTFSSNKKMLGPETGKKGAASCSENL